MRSQWRPQKATYRNMLMVLCHSWVLYNPQSDVYQTGHHLNPLLVRNLYQHNWRIFSFRVVDQGIVKASDRDKLSPSLCTCIVLTLPLVRKDNHKRGDGFPSWPQSYLGTIFDCQRVSITMYLLLILCRNEEKKLWECKCGAQGNHEGLFSQY